MVKERWVRKRLVFNGVSQGYELLPSWSFTIITMNDQMERDHV
jgi:hypothetical protein